MRIVLVGLLAASLIGCTSTTNPGSSAPMAHGKKAPSFTASDMKGQPYSFDPAQLQKPTLVVFFASWCGNCNKEAPEIVELYKKENARLDILGVDVDEKKAAGQGFLKKYGISYDVVYDPGLKISDQFKVKGTPTLVVIDRSGSVLSRGHALRDVRPMIAQATAN